MSITNTKYRPTLHLSKEASEYTTDPNTIFLSKNASYEHVVDADYVVSDRNSLINELTKKLIDDK